MILGQHRGFTRNDAYFRSVNFNFNSKSVNGTNNDAGAGTRSSIKRYCTLAFWLLRIANELEILTLIARGLSNREIATELFVSENTVKTHCSRAYEKLGAARRTQAVRRGKELGLLP